MIAQMGLFYGYKLAPSLLLAGAVFTLINTILRVGNVLFIGERFGWYEFFAIVLMVLAIMLLKIK
jgi:drug/metabolite transporter (DMT)-like permease